MQYAITEYLNQIIEIKTNCILRRILQIYFSNSNVFCIFSMFICNHSYNVIFNFFSVENLTTVNYESFIYIHIIVEFYEINDMVFVRQDLSLRCLDAFVLNDSLLRREPYRQNYL